MSRVASMIRGDFARPWTNREATSVTTLPESFLVLGGGPTGVELAQVYTRYGVPTTIVEHNERLLARDPSEAADLIERHIKNEPWGSVYDALLMPALNYSERDRLEQRLSPEEEAAVIEATRELLTDTAESIKRQQPAVPKPHRPIPNIPRSSSKAPSHAPRPVKSTC